MSGPYVENGTVIFEGQAKGYQRIRQRINGGDKGKESFYVSERLGLNFIFPDGSGKEGFSKYVIKSGNRYRANRELATWLSDIKTLRYLSSKYAEIIRLSKENPGNVFIYNEFVTGTGAIVLTLCFESQGFEMFEGNISMYSVVSKEQQSPQITKRLRYAFLNKDLTEIQYKNILDTFNDYHNRYGEYIKVLIVPPFGKEGINTSNVRQIHIVNSSWDRSSTYQAISRSIRSTSHIDLVNEARTKARQEGRDPNNVFIDIDIYQHVAMMPEDDSDWLLPPGTKIPIYPEEEGHLLNVDLKLYYISEMKDIRIKRIERMMKQSSFDCHLNYDRNIRPYNPGIDGSAECDYGICQYTCVTPKPKEIDSSSYDVLYLDPILNLISQQIVDMFKIDFTLSYQQIYTKLESRQTNHIDLAINQIIEKKIIINNRYGYNTYLYEDGNLLFISRQYPLYNNTIDYSISIYTSDLYQNQLKSLEEDVMDTQRSKDDITLQTLAELTVDDDNWRSLLFSLTRHRLIELVETALIKLTTDRSPLDDNLMTFFSSFIYDIEEPIELLEKSRQQQLTTKEKGRPHKITSQLPVIIPIIKQPSEQVIVHTLNSINFENTSYNAMSSFLQAQGDLRLFKKTDNQFRDVVTYEQDVYRNIIKSEIIKVKDRFINFPIYGVFNRIDHKFKIVIQSSEKVDRRRQNTGRDCLNYNNTELIDVAWRLKIIQPVNIELEEADISTITSFLKQTARSIDGWINEKKDVYFQIISLFNKKKIVGFKEFLTNILLGVGFRNTVFYYRDFVPEYVAYVDEKLYLPSDNPTTKNFFAGMVGELGLIGLGLFLILYIGLIRGLKKIEPKTNLINVIKHSLLFSLLLIIPTGMAIDFNHPYFWFIFGLASAFISVNRMSAESA